MLNPAAAHDILASKRWSFTDSLPIGDDDDEDEPSDIWQGYLPSDAYDSRGRRRSIGAMFRDMYPG